MEDFTIWIMQKFAEIAEVLLMELLDHLLIAQEAEYITIEQLNEFRQK